MKKIIPVIKDLLPFIKVYNFHFNKEDNLRNISTLTQSNIFLF